MKSLGHSNHVDSLIRLSSHFVGRFPIKPEWGALRVSMFKIDVTHSVLNKGLQVFCPFSLPCEGVEQSYSSIIILRVMGGCNSKNGGTECEFTSQTDI